MRTRRQRLGQHFLADEATARRIAAALPPGAPRVLEIGPGQGALTRVLLEEFGHVVAVEVDRALAASLPARLGRPAGLEVVPADVLDVDFEALTGGARCPVVGNLPYSVATPIVRRLLPRSDLFTVAVVMVQREVAERLVAPPGGAERGLLTVETELFAEAEALMVVPPGRFRPPPKVMSAVVMLRLHPAPAPEAAIERSLALASAAFTHRRKMLPNALGSLARPSDVAAALERLGLRPDARPQVLSARDWLALAGALAVTEGRQ